MSTKKQKKQEKWETKQCPSFDDNEIEKICVNKSCQGLRVFCISCWHKGSHRYHEQDVKGISEFNEIRKKVSLECDKIKKELQSNFDQAQSQLNKIKEAITHKYQIKDNQLNSVAPDQLNQVLDDLIKFNKEKLTSELMSSLNNLNEQFTGLLKDLDLTQSINQKISPQCAQTAKALYDQGYELFRDEKYSKAVTVFKQCLKNDPQNYLTCCCLGDCLRELEKIEEAIVYYEKAIMINPSYVKSYFGKEQLSYQQEYKTDEAIVELDKAIALDPDYIYSLLCKGKCLYELKQYEEAKEWTFKALIVDADDQEALYFQSLCLMKLKQYDEAIEQLDEALDLYSDDDEFLCLKGKCLMETDQNQEALEYADKALEIDFENAEAMCLKGQCLMRFKKFTQALKIFDDLLKEDPEMSEALISKGQCLIKLNKIDQAIKLFDQVLAEDETNVEALIGKGKILIKIKKGNVYNQLRLLEIYENKKTTLNQLELILCHKGKVQNKIGFCLIALDLFGEASLLFDQALKIKTNNQKELEGKNICNQKLKKKK